MKCLTAITIVMANIAAGQAFAQSTPATPSKDDQVQSGRVTNSEEIKVTNPEEIVITGTNRLVGGLMKVQRAPQAVSSVGSDAISLKTPLSSPTQLISTIPGVNAGSTDAYGLAIRNYVSIRGFDQTEIGWLVEGVPGIDPATYNPYTEAYADNENISDITVMAGNSRLQDPILNATGGEFIQSIRDPSNTFGGRLTGSLGSFKGRRGFARVDSGEIGNTGLTSFLSYSRTGGDVYIGPGHSTRDHIDFKAKKDWGNSSTSTLFVSYNDLVNARLPIITLATFNAADTANDFSAIPYLGTYPATGSTNYFRSYLFQRETVMVSNKNDITLSDTTSLHITPYFKYTRSVSPGGTSVVPTSAYNGATRITPVFDPALLVGGRIYATNNQLAKQYQYGVNAFLEHDFSDTNHLILGYWYDKWDDRVQAVLNPLNTNGEVGGIGPNYALRAADGTAISGSDFKIETEINQLFIGDTQSFIDNRLQITLGTKYTIYQASGTNYLPGSQAGFKATIKKWQPRLSVSFDATSQIQLYGNVVMNARMPLPITTYVNVYNVSTGRPTVVGNTAAEAETSVGEQLGLRYHGAFNLDANLFHVKLQNKQVQSLQSINGTNLQAVLSAGGVTFKGATAEVSSHRYAGFSLYANAQYLDAKLDDNLPVGTDFLPTRGKSMVLSPKWSYNLGLNYDRGILFGSATVKHVGSQFSTLMNDEKMPGFTTLDLSVGARLPSVGFVQHPVISANFINLTKGKYIASVATIQNASNNTIGLNGSTIAGTKPGYYMAAPFAATVSLSIDF